MRQPTGLYSFILKICGPGPSGQMAGATLIGAIFGFLFARANPKCNAVEVTLGCAAMGLLAGAILVAREHRRAKINSGEVKPHEILFWIIAIPVALIMLVVGMILLVLILDYFRVGPI